MDTTSNNRKEIKIPGPDHPITVSPAEGKIRITVAGKIVAESTRALRLAARDLRRQCAEGTARTWILAVRVAQIVVDQLCEGYGWPARLGGPPLGAANRQMQS
jgi:hypothetical protein